MVRMLFAVPWASGLNRLDVKLTAGKIRLPWVGEMPEVGIINAAGRLACCLPEKAKEQNCRINRSGTKNTPSAAPCYGLASSAANTRLHEKRF